MRTKSGKFGLMAPTTRYLFRLTSAFLVIGFVALMAIVLMNFWLSERARLYFDDVVAARDMRVAAVELRNAMQTAESSQRGFIITGNEIYLAPYQTAKTLAHRNLNALQTIRSDQSDIELTLQRLTSILASKFAEFDRTIALKRTRRDEQVAAIFSTNSGKALTDEANVFLAGIITRADRGLTSAVAEQRMNTNQLRLVSGVGALIIISVISGAAYGISRYTRELRSRRDQVNALNDELEQRVTVRTAELERARDRAEVLVSEINHRVANSLSLIASLVNLQSKTLTDRPAQDALAETRERILAISLVHQRLYASNNARSVALKDYIAGLLDHLRATVHGKGITVNYDLEPIQLETDSSINLGVVITELVINAFKYAYPEGVGEIRVRLRSLPDEHVELVVEDDGVGLRDNEPAKGTGVGTRIVGAMCTSLGAQISYRAKRPGTAVYLNFPLKPWRAQAAS